MKPAERELLELFRRLDEGDRATLLAFGQFLAGRARPESGDVPEPATIPRPDDETVVRAVKRLMATYHMLDRTRLLHETAHFMTQHVMHGRPAVEVIEELETMFRRHYETLRRQRLGVKDGEETP